MIKFLILLFLVSCAHKGHDKELSEFSYPWTVRSYTFTSQKQEVKMSYMDETPVGFRATILLLHGKNFGAWYWKPVMERFLKEGYRVIAPDQIGFGKSTKPESYQYTFQALAHNTKGLLEKLNSGRVIVVGHSMGGMLATRFALMYPQLVSKLVLMNPIGLEDWKTKVPYKSVDEVYAGELNATADSIREYQKKSYYDGQWRPEYEEQIEAAKGQLLHPDYPVVAWNSALTSDMIFTQPVVYEFPLIKAKTLLLIGTRDLTAIGKDRVDPETAKGLGLYESLGRKAKEAIPGSKLVELPGVGHMPQVEAFEPTMKAMLEFFNSRD